MVKKEISPFSLKDDPRKKEYQQVYTGGSEDIQICCAVISDNQGDMLRICLYASSFFTAETEATNQAPFFQTRGPSDTESLI